MLGHKLTKRKRVRGKTMKGNFLKSTIVLMALAILVVMPFVEANYMLGSQYIGSISGSTEKESSARHFAGGKFYEGRELPQPRDRSVKRYSVGSSYGRYWQPSTHAEERARPAPEEDALILTGRRCLGCELGAYGVIDPAKRRGKYYYSQSRISGRTSYVYLGDMRTKTSKLTTYGARGKFMLPRVAGQRSRLSLSERDLILLREELGTKAQPTLRTGTRCLSCMYESGEKQGKYYATADNLARLKRFVPLQ